jgi:hypothetical protein
MRTVFVVAAWLCVGSISFGQSELIGHLPLQESIEDQSGNSLKVTGTGVLLTEDGPTAKLKRSAEFDGIQSVIRMASSSKLDLSSKPFSVAAWINAPEANGDIPGDLISQYDSKTRTGFHLGLYSHGGVTNSQSNYRQLHFGIDQGQLEEKFTDHGQLGTAVYVFSLCVHDGKLYASTCHAGADEAGRVYRFEGGDKWTDLGSPDRANAISALTVFNGSLYAASSKYRLAGSSLAESENANFGGKVFRLGADDQWENCGTVSPETEGIASLIEFHGTLYAGSLYRPAGFFRYEGGDKWTACETPNGKRVEAMTVFNGSLFASCYDEGSVFRFDGKVWHEAGKIPNATQTYGFAVHNGSLYVSEWPMAHVYRYLGGTDWEDVGRLGEELETMPLLVYNGKMYGGTLPLAEVYRYDGSTTWTKIGRVDMTPDVRFRRAWSMAVYQGRLFVGALPSGRVLSIEAGRNATLDKSLPSGWHHVAAVRDADRLRLYVDGKLVSESAPITNEQYNLSSSADLNVGFGAQDFFKGRMADVRIYKGVLSETEIRQLAIESDSPPGKTTEK